MYQDLKKDGSNFVDCVNEVRDMNGDSLTLDRLLDAINEQLDYGQKLDLLNDLWVM